MRRRGRTHTATHRRSKFEDRVEADAKSKGIKLKYEPFKLKYIKHHTYTPDWVLPNGIIVETKGKWTGVDRTMHLLIRKQHPDLDIRFVFMRNNPLYKGSKTTYGDWCEKHGFTYAIGEIPPSWARSFKRKNKSN